MSSKRKSSCPRKILREDQSLRYESEQQESHYDTDGSITPPESPKLTICEYGEEQPGLQQSIMASLLTSKESLQQYQQQTQKTWQEKIQQSHNNKQISSAEPSPKRSRNEQEGVTEATNNLLIQRLMQLQSFPQLLAMQTLQTNNNNNTINNNNKVVSRKSSENSRCQKNRSSYSVEFKYEVLQYAKKEGMSAAEKTFGVPLPTVQSWLRPIMADKITTGYRNQLVAKNKMQQNSNSTGSLQRQSLTPTNNNNNVLNLPLPISP